MRNPVRPQFLQPNLLDVSPMPEVKSSVEVVEPLEDRAFRAVFDTSAEALVVVNSRGIVRAANRQAREVLQLKEATYPLQYESGLLSPSAAVEFTVWCERVMALRDPSSFDTMLPTGLKVRITFRAVIDSSQQLLLSLEETSVIQRAETKWRQGERQNQSKLLQTEKMAALGQLVSGIAHELNNPLTAIMGYGQLLLGHGLLAAQLSEASKIYQEAERARRIVKNLLYFARENPPERSRVDVNEIVERTLALRSYELKVENIAVKCDLAGNLPETMADPHQLQQVVLNLLVNAEQALLEGRGQGTVEIKTRLLPGDRISLQISDDGPGIPREIASRIFDPFFTTKPSGVGTGLGLSIVYGIVRQHGGEITAENMSGGGARFSVELPVIAAPARPRAPERFCETFASSQSAVSSRSRVLVVEDEPTVAQLIVDVLREEGHDVEAVLDSREGLTRIARHEYNLVICDLRMPRLDGREFYEALVHAGSPMTERIIFITGDMLAPRTLEFLEPNRFPYLAKPFLVEELKIAVNRLLDQGRTENEATARTRVRSGQTANSRT
jgi:signal transduction histidine kinase/FixJ family two-component response regulator